MASLQSNSTTSFKHHLTGEACLAWSLYIVRSSTIAKNRHLNIVLQAEMYLRTGTYDRPKNTLAIDSARAPLDSALAIDAPGAVSLLVACSVLAIDRYYCAGKSLLTHFVMKHHHLRSGDQKKKTRFAGLFFLTGLRPVPPLGQCPSAKHQNA